MLKFRLPVAKRYTILALMIVLVAQLTFNAFPQPAQAGAPSSAPVVILLTPSDDGVNTAVNANLTVTFSENVTAVTGKNIVIKQGWDDVVVESISVTDSRVAVVNNTVTIDPASMLLYGSDYYVQIDTGAFQNGYGDYFAGIADTTTWNFQTQIQTSVIAANSAEFTAYMNNSTVSTINLLGSTIYDFEGGTISRAVAIEGNGGTIRAGSGITDTVIRSDDVTVQSSALPNYPNVKSFMVVSGTGSSLSLSNVTLQNGANPIFDVINVKTGGSLVMNQVTVKDFQNNPTPGDNLSYGVHAEPGAISTIIQNSVFDKSNAFRNAVSIRNGAMQIIGNTFEGTEYPNRLRQSDGYEYAMYIYGGNGVITNNTITGYDSTTQQGYASAGISVIGFYATNVTITNNQLAYNESGVDVTRTWSPWSSNLSMTVNGLSLSDSDSAYQMGELLRAANSQDYVAVSFDQNDEVALTDASSHQYFGVMGGYRSPYLTASDVSSSSAVLHFPSGAGDLDILSAADDIALEQQIDDSTTWMDVTPTWVGIPSSVDLTLESGHSYRYRLKLTHSSYVETSDPVLRTLVTYSNPVAFQAVDLQPPQHLSASEDDGQSLLSWDTVTGATYYQIYMSTVSGQFIGAPIGTVTSTTYRIVNLVNGTPYYFVIKAGAPYSMGNQSNQVMVIPNQSSDNTYSTPIVPPASSVKLINVLVNGKEENAGTAIESKRNDQTVLTIAVDQKKLDDKLAVEGQGAVVTIPVPSGSDVIIGELNGQMVKNMENKEAVLEIKTDKATYTLPVSQINIDAISAKLGQIASLKDITIRIEISSPPSGTLKLVDQAEGQGSFSLVASPLDFSVTGTYGNTTLEVSKFSQYVERSVAIPEGTDRNKITTGVVIEPDGTVRHVPTKVTSMNGNYFAHINSLTNSTYAVVWHPFEFSDVADHWSKAAVNDMGSRMVINGFEDGRYDPDADITRAEFAAIVVRGLGLRVEKDTVSAFNDVASNAWYHDVIQTAHNFGLIQGFEDGSFRPNDLISREQSMVMIANAMKLTDLTGIQSEEAINGQLQAFTDGQSVAAWAATSVADIVHAGLVSGRSGKMLDPQAYVTRAEVATMMQLLLQKSGLI
ncbi:S-layer homology domain-containing protein [Paenibacillus ferrarius]|uniref:S-layer homology domain-containing protein n=1 Tax=Paenibacillus ferrarius TaxID=1469647 RepID=UPI003D2E6979